MGIETLLIGLLVLILVLFLVQKFVPLEGDLKQLLLIVIIIVFALWALGVV